MAKQTTTSADNYRSLVSGSFTATGQSASFVSCDNNDKGKFNAFLYGTFAGTVQLERSFDGGTTWVACSKDTDGTAAAYTGPVSLVLEEPEQSMIYRWNCTVFTSGTISYRLSK